MYIMVPAAYEGELHPTTYVVPAGTYFWSVYCKHESSRPPGRASVWWLPLRRYLLRFRVRPQCIMGLISRDLTDSNPNRPGNAHIYLFGYMYVCRLCNPSVFAFSRCHAGRLHAKKLGVCSWERKIRLESMKIVNFVSWYSEDTCVARSWRYFTILANRSFVELNLQWALAYVARLCSVKVSFCSSSGWEFQWDCVLCWWYWY